MKEYTLQIPYDESSEWLNALPLISRKKALALSKRMRQLTKKNGWNLVGFKGNLFVFRRKCKERFWLKGHARTTAFFYLALNIETNTTVEVNDGDEFETITLLQEIKKFLDPVKNRVIYANMAPWTPIRFFGVRDGDYITDVVTFSFDGD